MSTSKSAGKRRDDEPYGTSSKTKSKAELKREEESFSKYVKEQQKALKNKGKNGDFSTFSSGKWPIERLSNDGKSIKPIKPQGRVVYGTPPPSFKSRTETEPTNILFVADQVRDNPNPLTAPQRKSRFPLKVDSASFGISLAEENNQSSVNKTPCETNFDICQEKNNQCITSLEGREIAEFLDEVHKKRVSDSFRQRKHEEKLKRESVIQDVSSDLSYNKETVNTVNDQVPKLSHDTETVNDQDLRLPRGQEYYR
ncbi:13933_t:CDS:2 [Ambispora leptoticha]|uniref:13933_t:CDS:1 n=1 Tax=Ambispora leptoticha TaxID=144679 RepID=A0A9N9GU46_9GLOM|nr:13933_t:CDS:2 [Ambispora leptoticha]